MPPMGRLLLIVCLFMGGCGGCGDDSKVGRLPDAPPPPDSAIDAMVDASIDAMVDAPPDTPAPLTVKLTITRNGAAAQSVQVYFQNADNSLVLSVKTNNLGEAETVMEAGGSVTAINPFTTPLPPVIGGPSPQLRTFIGVKPGDHLFLTLNDDLVRADVNVTIPETDANDYLVNSTCGAGELRPELANLQVAALTGAISFASGCTTADFLVLARVVSEGTTGVGGVSHPDVDLTSPEGVDLSADSYTDPVGVTFHYINVSPSTGEIDAAHYLTSPRGMFVESYGGFISRNVESDEASTRFPEPDFATPLAILDSSIERNAPHNIISWGPNKPQYDVDLDDLLPDMTGSPGYDQSVQQVQWSETDDGATPDLSVAEIVVSRPEVQSWQWVVVAPYTRGTLQLPTLPNDGFDFMPGPEDSVDVNDLVNAKVTIASPAAAGYDAVRARILDIHEIGTSTSFVTGTEGQVVVVGPGIDPERRRRATNAIGPRPVRRLAGPHIHAVQPLLKAAKSKAAPTLSKAAKGKVSTPASSKGKGKAAPASTKALKAAKAPRAAAAASIAPPASVGAPSMTAAK